VAKDRDAFEAGSRIGSPLYGLNEDVFQIIFVLRAKKESAAVKSVLAKEPGT